MNIIQKCLIGIIIILLAFNIILLHKLSNLTAENANWKKKVTMSISEQLIFHEHAIEGLNLSPQIEELQHSDSKFNDLFTRSKNHKLIYHFWGNNCRNCLNMEIQIFNTFRLQLRQNGIDFIMLFVGFEEDDFSTLIQQYQIANFAIRDTTFAFLKKFAYIRNPIVLLLSHNNEILLANFSDYQNEEKSLVFYKKLEILIQDFYFK